MGNTPWISVKYFDEETEHIFNEAFDMAVRNNEIFVEARHIVTAILKYCEVAYTVLYEFGVDCYSIFDDMDYSGNGGVVIPEITYSIEDREIIHNKISSSVKLAISEATLLAKLEANQTKENASKTSVILGQTGSFKVNFNHFLWAAIKSDEKHGRNLEKYGLNYEDAKRIYDKIKNTVSLKNKTGGKKEGSFGMSLEPPEKEEPSKEKREKIQRMTDNGQEMDSTIHDKRMDYRGVKAPQLRKYCEDMVLKAYNGGIDPVIGRDEEIKQIVRILGRRKKNNPCLIGEAGVGKTAIVEGLALKIAKGEVPESLRDKIIVSLDLAVVLAGSKYRGEFEERIKRIINEARDEREIILFIDEMHILMGAGNDGAMDAANILKPYLASGELQVIGATTTDEYKKHIEKDKAMERRFQLIMVNEPNKDDCIKIVEKSARVYENYHKIKISTEVAKHAVYLSDRYINNRQLPDKAFDVLDLGCSLVKQEANRFELTKADLELVVSEITGIPVNRVQEGDKKALLDLELNLKGNLKGQNEAIDVMVKTIKRNKTGVSDDKRPIGSFLFIGPTGVGKTRAAQLLALHLFSDSNALLKLDMSEFMEKHDVSKLMGSPPGYVGYKDKSQLADPVRRKPYMVVLFDEIEKAHPDVLNILLQILEDGFITDAIGNKVSFKNAIIIMTSNIGVSELNRATVGFGSTEKNEKDEQNTVKKALKQTLRAELLNRIDNTVVFRSLSENDIQSIAEIELKKLIKRLENVNVDVSFDKNVLVALAEKGKSKEYGARELRRLIQDTIEIEIADLLLQRENEEETLHIEIVVEEGQVKVKEGILV